MPEVKCPVCGTPQATAHKITGESGKEVTWYHCYCDSLFHMDNMAEDIYTIEYVENYSKKKGIRERMEYLSMVYAPYIEESIYGRRFLDIGFTVPYLIEAMESRGWISTGVDLVANQYNTMNYIDFESALKFDFIHFGHVLQSAKDPQAALEKVYNLLRKDGYCLLTTPAPELLRMHGPAEFGHWCENEGWLYISRERLIKLAESIGFKVVLWKHNISKRFATWNDLHLLLVREQ